MSTANILFVCLLWVQFMGPQSEKENKFFPPLQSDLTSGSGLPVDNTLLSYFVSLAVAGH